jgi:hypothetical protein
MSDEREEHNRGLREQREEIESGGEEKYHERNEERGKLFVRERLDLLLDDGLCAEDGAWANCRADDKLPADGVVTGIGRIDGRRVAVLGNDSTVKAGSWGSRTVEKIIRIQEQAERYAIPLIYLVDSAGARITDQLEMFPGRRGAGKIFYNQVRLSGYVPQICLLFGPSAAGGAYIPAFCDVVAMVDGNASMYLGSPRMAEMVIGEEVTLEEMGGAEMHTSVSGCGDKRVESEREAIEWSRDYLSYFPQNWEEDVPTEEAEEPEEQEESLDELIPANQNRHRPPGRRLRVPRNQGGFRRRARHRVRSHRRAAGRHRREPADAAGRGAVRRFRRQGSAVHQPLRRIRDPGSIPRRRTRLHDRDTRRARGHHPPWSEADLGGEPGDGSADLRHPPESLRSGAVRDVGAGFRP